MRGIGLLFLLFSLALGIQSGAWTRLSAVLYAVSPRFLLWLQGWSQANLGAELWWYVLLPVLEAPAWVLPAGIGAALIIVSIIRDRLRKVG